MEHERKPIPRKLRFEIFRRDAFTCRYCGRRPPEVILEIDHIVPVVEGGLSELPNLITACRECNGGKGARLIQEAPCRDDVAQELPDLSEKREQVRAFYQYQQELSEISELNVQLVVDHFAKYGLEILSRGRASIGTFLKSLSPSELIEAVDIAFSRSRGDIFKYFCGIAWSKIRERRGVADGQ